MASALGTSAAFQVQTLRAARRGVDLPGLIASRFPRLFPTGPSSPSLPSVVGGPERTVRLRLPYNFLDYGVVTLWNNTTSPVTVSVSGSTFNNGQFYPFTILSGQNRSFYAPVVSGRVPLFQVSFNADQSRPIPLPQVNVVFDSPTYVPQGTAGWPYAIGIGVNGYFLSRI